jgi:hypothetical protein
VEFALVLPILCAVLFMFTELLLVFRAQGTLTSVASATRLGISDLLLQYPVLAERLCASDGHGPATWCVLNNGNGAHMELQRRRVRDETGLWVASYVPHDCAAVTRAHERCLPLTVARRNSPAAKVLWTLAERIWQAPACQRMASTPP